MSVESCTGLDIIHGASQHVRQQWKIGMNRAEAQANLNARAILFNCSNQILREHGLGISREEVEGAAIIERLGDAEIGGDE